MTAILSFIGRVNIALRMLSEKYEFEDVKLVSVVATTSKGLAKVESDFDNLEVTAKVKLGEVYGYATVSTTDGWSEFGNISFSEGRRAGVIAFDIASVLINLGDAMNARDGGYSKVVLSYMCVPSFKAPNYGLTTEDGSMFFVDATDGKITMPMPDENESKSIGAIWSLAGRVNAAIQKVVKKYPKARPYLVHCVPSQGIGGSENDVDQFEVSLVTEDCKCVTIACTKFSEIGEPEEKGNVLTGMRIIPWPIAMGVQDALNCIQAFINTRFFNEVDLSFPLYADVDAPQYTFMTKVEDGAVLYIVNTETGEVKVKNTL